MKNEYLDKIQQLIEESTGKDMPETAPAIATLLMKFRPAAPGTVSEGLTSEDVVDMLDAICTPTLNDVAKVMKYLGYRLEFGQYEFELFWAAVPCAHEHLCLPGLFDRPDEEI